MNLISELNKIENLELTAGVSLKNLTGFRTGGDCLLAQPLTKDSLIQLLTTLKRENIKFRVLGNGSNTIARDEGYDGVVIKTQKALSSVEVTNDILTASAGVNLIALCKTALNESLAGLEFAYGIPGTVGGAVYMNAGAYGGEIKDVILSAEYFDLNDLKVKTATNEEMKFGYRKSIFHDDRNLIILSASFMLQHSDSQSVEERMSELLSRRRDKQPLEYPSCGSTFKRPVGSFAGALIEECGLKGYRIGGAEVSTKHAGFIINAHEASSEDIFSLIKYVQKTVEDKTGYCLECEVEVLE